MIKDKSHQEIQKINDLVMFITDPYSINKKVTLEVKFDCQHAK